MHTLSFDECNDWQKKLALYFGSKSCGRVLNHLKSSKKLRIDYISSGEKKPFDDLLGITILPGRKDRGRNLTEDIYTIKNEQIKIIVCLLNENEFHDYGVDEMKKEYVKNGFDVCYFKILDQGVGGKEEMNKALEWV